MKRVSLRLVAGQSVARLAKWGAVAGAVLLAGALPLLLPLFPLRVAILTLIYAILALSLGVLMGYAGMESLGQAAFFGIGAYAVGILTVGFGVAWWAAALAALALSTVAAVVVGAVSVRLTGLFFLVMTLAFSQVFWGSAHRWGALTGGTLGLHGVPRPFAFMREDGTYYYVVLIFFAFTVVLLSRLVRSPFGLSLLGIRDQELRMRSNGYNVWLHRFLAFTVCGAMAGAAGGRFAEVFRGSRRDYLRSLGLGLLNPFLYYVVLFEAYDRLPAQEAQPLNYTWAFTLALLAVPLLGHRLSRWDLLGGLIAYSGVWIIATRGSVLSLQFDNPAGVALALASTVLWALYWIYSARDRREPLVTLFCSFAMGVPFVLLACALTAGFAVEDWRGIVGAAYVGVFEMGVAFALWLAALRSSTNVSRIGNLIFLSPFLSLVFIRIFVGETILPSTYVGLVLIVSGLVVQQSLRTRRAR